MRDPTYVNLENIQLSWDCL